MKVISLNAGRPREIFHQDRMVRIGIFKQPVERRLRVTALNLEGDEQADLVHGGPSKAVYAYPSEHYDVNTMRCAARVKALPNSWRACFRDRLDKTALQADNVIKAQGETSGLLKDMCAGCKKIQAMRTLKLLNGLNCFSQARRLRVNSAGCQKD